MFGLFKKKYPVLKANQIEPVEEPINTTIAKKIFKDYMASIGFLDKDELSEHAGYFADEVRDHEECLRDDLADEKQELKEAMSEVKKLKAKLAKIKDEDEREDLQIEIDDQEEAINEHKEQIEKQAAELASFKKDKRMFLVEYINQQVHGSKWRSVAQ
ncbi:hypothetical protein [Microbulbifer sp. Q7]|uniref:hypothetical protein n=1 Tax=Microbulbifer sp. Q7 TaxID=1785091 RepID=UPI000832AD6C|nr:hypothetical protein [Microbulbifer sp. Q7]